MKKYYSIPVILILFFLANISASFAQAGVATVDIRILLMLHPLMMDFDYSIGRFYRESTKGLLSNDVWAMMDKARKEAEPKTKELKDKEKELQDQKIELLYALERATNRFAPGDIDRLISRKKGLGDALKLLKSTVVSNRTQQEINKAKINDLEAQIQEINDILLDLKPENKEIKLKKREEIKEAIAKIDKDILDVQNKILDIEEQAVSVSYLTTKESNERIEKAKSEIMDLIKKAAKESKFSMVLDTTFAMRSTQRKRRNNVISINDDSPDVIGASLFHYFSNLEDDPEMVKHLEKNLTPEDARAHLVAGRTVGMQSNIKQYLEFRNYVPEQAANFSNGKIFLVGGNDITTYIARQLIDRYNVPNSTKEMLLKTVKDYMNFEIEPYSPVINY